MQDFREDGGHEIWAPKAWISPHDDFSTSAAAASAHVSEINYQMSISLTLHSCYIRFFFAT